MLVMKTERLIIRRFKAEDWQDLFEYLSQESVVKYEPYGVFTEDACKQESINRSQNPAFWAVCLKESNKLIGNIYFQQQEPRDFLTWEIGYVFNPKYYGNGYATEGCKQILKYGFEQQGAHRIIGKCNPLNTASSNLLERLKMRREANFTKPAFFKRDSDGNPIWHDAYLYAMVEEEWLGFTK